MRRVLDQVLTRDGALVYGASLFEKLARRGVSVLDLLHVCRRWEVLRSTRFEYGEWRYRIEGPNLDGKWMAVVLSVQPEPVRAVAITAFRFARGRKTR
ncbi:MAG: hypothetical protein ABIO65_02775 [Nitrospiria bacterium]